MDSPIQEDERVVLFPTHGRLTEDGSAWVLDIHGWIFEPEEGSLIRRDVKDLFRAIAGLEPDGESEEERFSARAGAFLVDNERGKEIPIRLGETVHVLEKSGPNGHFRGSLRIPKHDAEKLQLAPGGVPGRLSFRAVTRADDPRQFPGHVLLLEKSGLSVISDIDDTIKLSHVLDRKALFKCTFLEEYRDVSGMADVYRQLAKDGAAFHYLSASPWQLFEPLSEFLRAKRFPEGSFHLRHFRLLDQSFLQIFATPEEHKLAQVESLLERFPERKFVLIGDSGEKDPEVYGAIARKHGGRIERVWIRDVTGEKPGEERYRLAFEGVPDGRWRIFTEPEDILLVK